MGVESQYCQETFKSLDVLEERPGPTWVSQNFVSLQGEEGVIVADLEEEEGECL